MFIKQLARKVISNGLSIRGYASKSLYVGNIPWTTTKEDLSNHFSAHSPVHSVSMPIDQLGRSKGFAFVEIEEEAIDASIEAFNNTDFNGRNIRVSLANTPKARFTPRNEQSPEATEQ